ncbi:MAG: SpoIID/LytB domain-containing protein [Crocinitomicaceae bacterium]|nr:SpoIID/LytB domain-containing protein [Crocinitomicaceae bacterium]
MRQLLLILIFIAFGCVNAQEVSIGVLRDYNVNRVTFSHFKKHYSIYADTSYIGTLEDFSYIEVQLNNGRLLLSCNTVSKGSFKKIRLTTRDQGGAIIVTSKSPIVRQRKYEDNFEVKVVSGRMTIVNKVQLPNYLSGVIESEGGGGRAAEYYKVQALMSRTYALKNLKRHKKEGFQLCDGVHCQAYHSMLRFTPEIRTAVNATKGEVLVDENNKIVSTYFSANCGGQVCDASHVWNNSVPYVQSFLDTFCIHTKQAKWTKTIPKSSWRSFLVNEYGYPIQDSVAHSMMYTFEQEQRKAFYIHPSLGIPLRDLRRKFKLKSTFFSVHPQGDNVVLNGRGFGHGVGLCQEGAMKMARSNYSYVQIALFYFTGVKVVKYDQLKL